jgi:hypothetical protein
MIRFLKLLFLIPLLVPGFVLSAQDIPGGISYQAVARYPNGQEIPTTQITIRLALITGSPSGLPEWIETHVVKTDAYGLFSLIIGEGSKEGGSAPYFSSIDWGSGNHFLKVEVDFGTGYRYMGTSPFMAVPYALFAKTAGQVQNVQDADSTNELITSIELQGNNLVIREGGKTKNVDLSRFYSDGNDDQQLAFNQQSGILSLENGGSVDLSTIAGGNDQDSTNELISSIRLNGTTLEIQEGNQVRQISLASLMDNTDNQDLQFDAVNQHLTIERGSTLIDLKEIIMGYDGSSTNEIQHLTQVGSLITLDKNGGSFIDADIDSTNELQTLGLKANVLNISDGNSVTFNFDDADADPVNEIQDLSLSANLLTLSKDPTPASIDLSPYLDNTDNQTLSVDVPGNTLSISRLSSGSSTVSIDADPTNEIQDLQITGNSLKITKNASASSISLAPYLDNTDNQSLSINSGTLSITGGNNVNIRESIIAFRSLKKLSATPIFPNDSILLIFNLEAIDTQNSFDAGSGVFTVPLGGEGLYNFTVCYDYASTQVLRLVKNDQILETLQPFESYSFLLNLSVGDRIAIRLVNPASSSTFNNSIGSFMGFRINQ